MEILKPSRLPSLEPQKLTIRSHVDEIRTVNLEQAKFSKIYPFETLFNLKQRIALAIGTTPPNQLFIALEIAPNLYKPLEFTWPFATEGLPDPHTVREQPDSRIYADGAKKPVFPTIYTGKTIESTVEPNATIHVWTLASLLTPNAPLTEPVFEGFVRLYFPQIKTPPSGGVMTKDALDTLNTYRDYVEKRLEKLDTGIRSATVQNAKPAHLTKLYIFKCILPKTPAFTSGLLELRFYEMKPSPTKPFLRFFPAKDRIPSIVKIATNEDGKTFIHNEKLLDSLMADKPSTDMGAVILVKVPIVDQKAPLGTCWTLRIYEDGSAEMYIGAPRRGAPLPLSVIAKADAMFRTILADTPWATLDAANLCELTAEYELNTTLDVRKPGKTELVNRVDPFSPMLAIDPPIEGDGAALTLRYKGVSNYVKMGNPIMNYLTALYLNRSSKSTTDVPAGEYVKALVKEFGISAAEAAAAEDDWLQRHSEHVITYKSESGDDLRIKEVSLRDAKCSAKQTQSAEEDTTIAAYNVGASIRIYNDHPRYRILITGCETTKDLERMLTLMTLFVSQMADSLKVGTTAAEKAAVVEVEPEETAAEAPAVPEELESAFDEQLFQGMLGIGDDEEEEETEAEAAPSVPAAAAAEPQAAVPTALAPNEVIPPLAKEWYLDNLKSRDRDLFQYSDAGDPRLKAYSRQCQLAQNRQPNVLSPEAYRRAQQLYLIPGTNESKVIWLEAPLNRTIQRAAAVASKTTGQRTRIPGMPSISKAEVAKLEIIALEKGFPLKDNKSVTEGEDKLKDQNKKIKELIVAQEKKPLWIVTKTGTDNRHINYYICAEFWCVRDDLPLIKSEVEGTVGYDGTPKMANSCVFCHGTLIVNRARPAIGETVLKRGNQADSGKVAKYSGFLGGLFHPEKYGLPCCFTEPKKSSPPEGAKMPEDEETVPSEETAPPPAAAAKDIANRDRPFSSVSRVERAGQSWYIPAQNVLGRIKLDWFELEKGAIAVPPESVNKFLGQKPDNFLTINRGVEQKETNSHLLPYRDDDRAATAFIRYGIGHNPREPGKSLLALIGWAQYATEEFRAHSNNNQISTEATVLEWFMKHENTMARAFEQANYGTLIHEFATSKYSAENVITTGKIQEWCTKMGIDPSNMYSKSFYSAWHNFKDYVENIREPKELRLWESLFTVPGLFTATGFILIRIRVPKNKNEVPTLICPQFGVSLHDSEQPPPFLFILEDEVTGNYDPLILYDGKTEKDKKMYGVIQTAAATMATIPPNVAAALKSFINDYVSVDKGCSRAVAPVHPWIPVYDTIPIPSLTELVALGEVDTSNMVTRLLRDRSNRLVGVISPTEADVPVFIPCVDDGLILPTCPSAYGETSLPQPDIAQVLEKYMKPGVSSCTPADAILPGLLPVALRKRDNYFIALDLRCGAIVPIKPFKKSKEVAHPCYAELIKTIRVLEDGDEPWKADLALMGPIKRTSSLQVATKEEELDEAYQHLRITFSEFLASPEGARIKAQIELLRQAKHRLPLFELQKRLDRLLYPIISQWIHRDDERAPTKPSVLRRDCLQIKTEGECVEGCSWTEGEESLRKCLIHTTKTERYLDPVHLMASRLTDELLRTFGKAMEILTRSVPRLKPLLGSEVRYENNALLFSATGRGSETLYDRLGYKDRQSTRYTTGLTYPEEVGVDESSINLPADWEPALYRIQVSAYVSLDHASFRNKVMRTITKKDVDFHGSYDDWKALATEFNVTIIKTHYNSITHMIEPVDEIGGPSTNFIIVDVDGIPLQNRRTTGFTLTEEELPASIRSWRS